MNLTDSFLLMANGPAKESRMAWKSDGDRCWATFTFGDGFSALLHYPTMIFCIGCVFISRRDLIGPHVHATINIRWSDKETAGFHFRVYWVRKRRSFCVATVSIALSIYWIGIGLQLQTFCDLYNSTINYIWRNDKWLYAVWGELSSYLLDFLLCYRLICCVYILDRSWPPIETFLGHFGTTTSLQSTSTRRIRRFGLSFQDSYER